MMETSINSASSGFGHKLARQHVHRKIRISCLLWLEIKAFQLAQNLNGTLISASIAPSTPLSRYQTLQTDFRREVDIMQYFKLNICHSEAA
jgi:hypothetical protein